MQYLKRLFSVCGRFVDQILGLLDSDGVDTLAEIDASEAICIIISVYLLKFKETQICFFSPHKLPRIHLYISKQ